MFSLRTDFCSVRRDGHDHILTVEPGGRVGGVERRMYEETVNTRALRRVKPVEVRVLAPGEADVIGEPVPWRAKPAAGSVIEEVAKTPDAPVVDPTHYGKRRRRKDHVWRYRSAQVAVALSMIGTAAAVLCLLLGDRQIARVVGGIAVGLAVAGLVLCWRSQLARRVIGYAVAASLLSVGAAAASLALPDHWFEDSGEMHEGQVQQVRPRGN